MKILSKGTMPANNWWIGRHLQCKSCKTIMALEPNDYVVKRLTSIECQCPVCETVLTLNKI